MAAKKKFKKPAAKKPAAKKAAKAPAKKAAVAKKPASKKPAPKASAKNSAPRKAAAPKKAPAGSAAPAKAKSSAGLSLGAKIKGAVKATVGKATEIIEHLIHPDMFQSLTPLEDRLVVQVEKAEAKTAGGLYVPGTVATKPTRGRVMAVGRGKRSKKGALRPPDVQVGDFVVFPEYAGQSVTLQGIDFLILREEDVLGVSES